MPAGSGVPVWRAGRRFATPPRAGAGARRPATSPSPDGTRARPARPRRARPDRPDHARRLDPGPRGSPAGLPALRPAATSSRCCTSSTSRTGRDVEPPIDRCRYSDVAWLPGGRGVLLRPHGRPGRGAAGRAGVPPPDLAPPPRHPDRRRRPPRGPRPLRATTTTTGSTSPTTAAGWSSPANVGTARRDSVWIADLHGDAVLTPVLTQADDVRCGAWVERDGRLYLLTTDGAPRFRLAVTDPATPGREHWRELVAEDPDSVLEGVRWLQPAGSADPADGAARARPQPPRHRRGGAARPRRHARAARSRCPGSARWRGLTTADPATPGQQGRLWIGWTDLVTPQQVRRFDLETGDDRPGRPPLRARSRCRPCGSSSGS